MLIRADGRRARRRCQRRRCDATIDAAQLSEIRAALLEHHVLALRDQRLDPAALSAFAARLGEREVYPFAQSLPDDPYVVPIVKEPEDESNFGGIWHTDSSYLPEPPSLTLLYAVSLPKQGGDTLFADMHAAYDALPQQTRIEIDGLTAQYTASLVHDDGGAYAQVAGANRNRRAAGATVTDAIHPVVRTHPDSRTKALYVSLAHTRCFVGRTREESLPLLTQLGGTRDPTGVSDAPALDAPARSRSGTTVRCSTFR